MVARRDEHRDLHLSEAAHQLLAGFGVIAVAVQQISGQQHQVHLLPTRQLRQRAQQLPLLLPTHGGLSGAQALEGGVQVQIRRMEDT